MYKYTAHPRILQLLRNAGRTERPWDAEYRLAKDLFGVRAAFGIPYIWKKYRMFEFYSRKPLREVPLNGVLLPVALFSETEV